MVKPFKKLLLLLLLAQNIFAFEFLFPVSRPHSEVLVSSGLDIRNDVYSNDIDFYGEFAPAPRYSFFFATDYRAITYEQQITPKSEKLHSGVDLDVSGVLGSLLGFKYVFYRDLGVSVSAFVPVPGRDLNEQHAHVEGEIFFSKFWSRYFSFGAASAFRRYRPRNNFNLGSELSSKITLGIFIEKCEFYFTGLLARRIENSKNKNLEKAFQNMHDKQAVVKFKTTFEREFRIFFLKPHFGLSYDFAYGALYAKEPAHKFEVFARFLW